jgi:hypothetical protein
MRCFSSFTKTREGFLGQQILVLYVGTKKLQAKYGSSKKKTLFYFIFTENINL